MKGVTVNNWVYWRTARSASTYQIMRRGISKLGGSGIENAEATLYMRTLGQTGDNVRSARYIIVGYGKTEMTVARKANGTDKR